jgi:hypothetical protein
MNDTGKSVRILVAPLDWGLGHATRCIPIIGQLYQNGCEVVLAADGAVARLLAREFPQLEIKTLPGYKVKYGHAFLKLSGMNANGCRSFWIRKSLKSSSAITDPGL